MSEDKPIKTIKINTSLGSIKGIEQNSSYAFLGVRYAKAKRFEYATLKDELGPDYDATHFGDACIQKRCYYAHLEIPERMFYHKEFRDGLSFTYSEDCLNLNIYTPKEKGVYPVIVFIHGGGFDSGAASESGFDGDALAKRGIVTVFIQYRVGVFGYFTHEDISKECGHEGNFGLDDQVTALKWVKKNIASFGGDPNNVTVMGQSAGAMSIQCMLLSPLCKGLFEKAIMMSGAGRFPSIATPKNVEERREYWLDVMKECGATMLKEFKAIEPKLIFDALERVKARRKDNQISTMTMVDHYYLPSKQEELFKNKIDIPSIVGFTNNDMYTALLAHMALKYASKNGAYLYYFDVDAKGDDNKAFHSSDLRYAFGTLESSWRPYGDEDKKVSELMMDYFSTFACTGNPNAASLPLWEKKRGKALCFRLGKTKMGRPNKWKLLRNTFLGDPK
jgi:carboxylesterase type B